MERVSANTLKNHLARYLKLVQNGETVIITSRGEPVARLIPERPDDVVAQRADAFDRLNSLRSILKAEGKSMPLGEILEMRDEGRCS